MTSRPRQSRSSGLGEKLPNRPTVLRTEKVEGSCPETNVISLEHRPTGRCFKTNPQHTRPLSGANFLAASELRFERRTTTGRSPSPPRQANPQGWKSGRAIVLVLVFMYQTNPPRRRRRMCSRGGESRGGRTCSR